jgi:hypothetical protein
MADEDGDRRGKEMQLQLAGKGAGKRARHGPSMVTERPIICAVGPTQRKADGRHSAIAQADATHTGNPSDSASPRRTSAPRAPPSPPESWEGAASTSAAAARHQVLDGMPRSGAAGRRRRRRRRRRLARCDGVEGGLRWLWVVRRCRRGTVTAAAGAGGAGRRRGMPQVGVRMEERELTGRLTFSDWEKSEKCVLERSGAK